MLCFALLDTLTCSAHCAQVRLGQGAPEAPLHAGPCSPFKEFREVIRFEEWVDKTYWDKDHKAYVQVIYSYPIVRFGYKDHTGKVTSGATAPAWGIGSPRSTMRSKIWRARDARRKRRSSDRNERVGERCPTRRVVPLCALLPCTVL